MEADSINKSDAASSDQITKKQHWAPVMYFKRFPDEKGNLKIIDKTNWRFCKDRHYSNVCFEDFFYGRKTGVQDELSQAIERHFNKAETFFEDEYDNIVANIDSTDAIKEDYLRLLSLFMAKLWLRSKLFRKQTNDFNEQITKHVVTFALSNNDAANKTVNEIEEKMGITLTDEERVEGIQAIKDKKYKIKYDNTYHLQTFKDVERYANLYFAKNWRFYIAEKDFLFFTSDTPVIDVSTSSGFYENTIFQRKQYFPLTPRILIELVDPYVSGKRAKRRTLYDYDKVFGYNLIRVNHSDEFVYSASRDCLDDMLKRCVLKQNSRHE